MIDRIESTALPREDTVLRAIFSQIIAEVRKTGRVLSDDEGSFYVSKRFSWGKTTKEFFDAYHKICERKQVMPIYQESALSSALKVPFASIDTLNLLHDATIKRLMQFRERRVPPFGKLPLNPTIADLRMAIRENKEDADICRFLELVILVDEELREYARQLDELVAAYKQRLDAYVAAMDDGKTDRAARLAYEESNAKITRILAPYILRLKVIRALPAGWYYSFKSLPLTDEGASYLSIQTMSSVAKSYWEAGALPSKAVLKAAGRAWEKEMKRKDREWKKRSRKAAGKSVGKKLELSTRSLWERFDSGVSDIGDWFSDNMDKISDWVMTASIGLLIACAVAFVIGVWILDGFFMALVVGFVILAAIGLLSSVLELLAGLVAVIVKYVAYVPLFLLRCIFYRGWTFILFLLSGCGYLTYLILKAKFIV